MEEFDLERFVDLFDTAMSSDNPTVKKAFKNLMMVAALVEGENQDPKIGPMRGLLKSVENLQQRVSSLEIHNNMSKAYGPTISTTPNPYTPYSASPNWIAPTYTYTVGSGGAGGMAGGNGAGGAGSNISASSYMNESTLASLFDNLDNK